MQKGPWSRGWPSSALETRASCEPLLLALPLLPAHPPMAMEQPRGALVTTSPLFLPVGTSSQIVSVRE